MTDGDPQRAGHAAGVATAVEAGDATLPPSGGGSLQILPEPDISLDLDLES
jgi:hypothetical protein